MKKNDYLENRLEEWARWAIGCYSIAGLNYSPVAPGFSESIKSDRTPVVSDDREMEIERAISALAKIDQTAADVIRAEYRAHPKYGHAHYEDSGNDCTRTHKQLGISERTYRTKLDKAQTAVWVAIRM
ncbi:antiterminator Q family protein [Saccharospirillum sp. MSK14-1]|uniref:antiterminator Q family protein n=1 Tax=Saccharospirillum sp. MSK14-1 TaxID=1897632 RepID=UPI0011B281CB|nr:antiterminator Q family protein [Saccharospirillum sp. MSK14-1]